MPTRDPRREAHFPAIEKRYGEPMKHWFAVMKTVAGKRYPEQIAHLRENFGFSQAHANALVMFSRGSTTTQRHATPTAYFKSIDAQLVRLREAQTREQTTASEAKGQTAADASASRALSQVRVNDVPLEKGIAFARFIDIDDSEEVLRAIRLTSDDTPIDIVLHTPGGLVLAAEQIAPEGALTGRNPRSTRNASSGYSTPPGVVIARVTSK